MADKIGCTQIVDVSMIPAGIPVDYFVAHKIVSALLDDGYMIIQSKQEESPEKIKVFFEMSANKIT